MRIDVRRVRWIDRTVQDLAEAIETVLPGLAPGADPGLDGVEPVGLQATRPDTADLAGRHEARALEDLEVLDHRRQRHRHGSSHRCDGCRPAAELLNDPTPRGIGQRSEEAVDVGRLVKHEPNY